MYVAFFALYRLTVWRISGIITKESIFTRGGGGLDTVKRLCEKAVYGRFGQGKIDLPVMIVAYLLPFLGIIDGRLFAVAAVLYLPIIIYSALSGGLYLLYPVFFFFYGQLVIPGGIVLFRLYTLAFMARTVFMLVLRLWRRETLGFRFARIAFAAFLLLTALRYALFGGFIKLGAILDLCFLLCFATEAAEVGDGAWKRFSDFSVAFVFASLASCVVGVFVSSEGRYLATLNDPNYLGFYLNIAILTVFLHPFFGRLWVKLPILGVLYCALIASESITGVICNAAVVVFCIATSAFMGRFKLKYLIIPLICGVVALQLVFVSQSHDWGALTVASARVIDKLEALFIGDLSEFTTARSSLWRINLEKYIGFDFWESLFGGTAVSAVGRDTVLFPQTSHQELLDVLLSTGALGLTVYLALFIVIFVGDAVNLRKMPVNDRSAAWMRIGIKLIWLFYAFGLTMFLNGRFFVPLLV